MKGWILSRTVALAAALLAGGLIALPVKAADVITEWASVKAPPPPELKAVSVDPKTTALLVLDFLPGGYCEKSPRCMAALPTVKKMLDEARAANATVIYSIAGNFTKADILKQVAPIGDEPIVKSHADKFIDTDLEKILKDKGIQTVIVTGTAGNGAGLYTASHAGLIGFKVVVPVDGIPSSNLYAEQFTIWQLANGPGFGQDVTITRSEMIKF